MRTSENTRADSCTLSRWSSKWQSRIAILIVTWLGFGLRILNVGRLGLLGDEGATFLGARAIVLHGVPILDTGLWVNRGLGYSYLVAAFLSLCGESEFALRLPGVLVGTLTIAMSYKLCKSLFDCRRTALIAAAIVALHPWEIEFSRTAREYVMLQLWTVLLLYCFYLGFIRESKAHRLLFALIAVISTIDHLETISLLLLLSILPLVKPWKQLFSPGYLLTCVTASAGPVGYFFLRPIVFYGISVMRPPNTKASTAVNVASKVSLLTQGSFGSFWVLRTLSAIAGPVLSGVVALGSVLVLLLLVRLAVIKKKISWVLPAAYLYWSLLVLLAFFSMLHKGASSDVALSGISDMKPRHIYHIFPLAIYAYSLTASFLLRLVLGLSNRRAKLRGATRASIITLLSVVAVLAVVSPRELPQIVFRTYSDPLPDRVLLGTSVKNALSLAPHYDSHPDYKTTSLYVAEHYREGDAVLVTQAPPIHFFYLGDKVTHRIGLSGGAGAFIDSIGQVRERRVNIPRIVSIQSILDVMSENDRVWIIDAYGAAARSPVEKWLRDQSERLVYLGKDDKSKVYLFDRAVKHLYSNYAWDLFYALQDVEVTAERPDPCSVELGLNRQQIWTYNDQLFLGPSDSTAGGVAFNNQLLFHPFSDDASTNVRILIEDNQYSFIETAYALADVAFAAGSNGVEYSILTSVDGGSSWRVLLREPVRRADWKVRKIDIRPYQGQRLILRLTADPMGQYDYDWLQITFRMLPDEGSTYVASK